MNKLISDSVDKIIALCEKHKVISFSLFGSAARDTMTENSDIDFLVSFSEDLEVLEYADNYFSLLDGLETIIGKKIDLVSVKSLKNPILKEAIYSSKIDLYAA